jgi:hypothetical protein
MERLRGFAIAVGLIAAGIVVAVRGEGWGYVVVLIGVGFGLWVTRWERGQDTS